MFFSFTRFFNDGVVEIDSGRVTMVTSGSGNGPISHGSWTVAEGAYLEFSGVTYTLGEGTTMAGPGQVRVPGSVDFNSTGLSIPNLFIGGDAAFDAPTFVGTAALSRSISGQSSVTFSNSTWAGGTMGGGGTTIIPAGGILRLASITTKLLAGRTLVNAGHVLWSDTGPIVAAVCNQTVNSITNEVSGEFEALADAAMSTQCIADPSGVFAFYNYGRFVKSAGSNATAFRDVPFHNSGIVQVEHGGVEFYSTYAQSSGGTLALTADGHNAGTDYGHVTLIGQASLGGLLQLEFVNGFLPADSDQFALVTFSENSGSFSQFQAAPLPGGFVSEIHYSATTALATFSDHRPHLEPLPPTAECPLQFTVRTKDNKSYQIQSSPDLIAWTFVANVPTGQETFHFCDPAGVSSPQRFYRIVSP